MMTEAHMEFRPQALGQSVRRVREVLPEMPIMITENGIATADDDQRIAYTKGSLQGLQAAIADGADVRGYLHWSLLDNFEWFSGYAPTFGLIAVDRNTFARTPETQPGVAGRHRPSQRTARSAVRSPPISVLPLNGMPDASVRASHP